MSESSQVQGGRCLDLTDEEVARVEKYGKEMASKAVAGALFYPLAHVKVLFQLGYEPFPLTTGKAFGIGGHQAYFLPNGFSYARSLVKKFGWWTLYNGVDAAIVSNIVGGSVTFATSLYLDRYHPEMGGKPVNLDKEEGELTDAESARRALRSAVRDMAARSLGTIIARPLTVVMVRKVAQLIGGELKYTNVVSSLCVIGREEGPPGLFSGLVPQLIAEFITVIGVHSFIYAIERSVNHLQVCHAGDKDKEEIISASRKALHLVAPFLINTIAYPYTVVSTVMAVTGSGLLVSLLPYSPAFGVWQDAWDYLKPTQGLKRGARMFFREHPGAVRVGADRELYAATKHFM